MATTKQAPAAVRKIAAPFLSRFGDSRLVFAGTIDGADFWHIRFNQPVVVGYPVVIRYAGGNAERLDGEAALRVLSDLDVED